MTKAMQRHQTVLIARISPTCATGIQPIFSDARFRRRQEQSARRARGLVAIASMRSLDLTRRRLGANLAREYPVKCRGGKCDLVMPIPDSGNYAALGFAKASKIPYEVGLIRNHYIGRTFIQPLQYIRDFSAPPCPAPLLFILIIDSFHNVF